MPASRSIQEVYEPEVVGVPPSNAFRNLVLLPDGTVRCYGSSEEGRPVYMESLDCGLTWSRHYMDTSIPAGHPGQKVEGIAPAWSPYSGDFYYLEKDEGSLRMWRSKSGIDGTYEMTDLGHPELTGMVRPPQFLAGRQRVLVAAMAVRTANGRRRYHPAVLLSDDDGCSWRLRILDSIGPHPVTWPHRGLRWQNYACEPTVAELSTGRLWMLMRTSTDNLHEAFSDDGGHTWTAPRPSRFYATNTMPTLARLKDGRLLLLWCNTTPLPERDHSQLIPSARGGAREPIGPQGRAPVSARMSLPIATRFMRPFRRMMGPRGGAFVSCTSTRCETIRTLP